MAVYQEQTPLPNKFRPIIHVANQWTVNGAPEVNRMSYDEISRMTPSPEKEKKGTYLGISKNLTKNIGAIKDTVVSSSLTKKRNQFYRLSPSDNFVHVSNMRRNVCWDKGYC